MNSTFPLEIFEHWFTPDSESGGYNTGSALIKAKVVDTNGDGIDDLTDGSFTLSYSCAPVIQGCLDECACNYNAAANVDNGSCDFFSCVTWKVDKTITRNISFD
jgi:hypothetical protein